MSANKSAYLRTRTIKHNMAHTAFTMPAAIYLALYTSDPTINDTGTEVTGGSYARVAITPGTESGGVIANSNSLAFTALPTAAITHWGIRDAAAAGNLLYFGPLDQTINTVSPQNITIAAGNVQISEA